LQIIITYIVWLHITHMILFILCIVQIMIHHWNFTTHWTSNNAIAILQHFNINVVVSPFCFTQFGLFVCCICLCVNWKLKFQNQESKQLCVIFVWCLSVKNFKNLCKILVFAFLLKVHSLRF
jgi:hypothetical protein